MSVQIHKMHTHLTNIEFSSEDSYIIQMIIVPIAVTLVGITIDDKLVQSEKAE